MRVAVVVLLLLFVACADHGKGSAMPMCGGAVADGATCQAIGTCFKPNSFSGCASEVCTCGATGRYSCHGIDPAEGKACTDSPIDSCSFEGNPSCDTAPTSQFCGCDADGTWHCECACYGGFANTCSSGCPVRFPTGSGTRCAAPLDCTYPEGTCHCVADPDGTSTLHCTP